MEITITLKTSKGGITMTLDEAREIYEKLNGIFGNKDTAQWDRSAEGFDPFANIGTVYGIEN